MPRILISERSPARERRDALVPERPTFSGGEKVERLVPETLRAPPASAFITRLQANLLSAAYALHPRSFHRTRNFESELHLHGCRQRFGAQIVPVSVRASLPIDIVRRREPPLDHRVPDCLEECLRIGVGQRNAPRTARHLGDPASLVDRHIGIDNAAPRPASSIIWGSILNCRSRRNRTAPGLQPVDIRIKPKLAGPQASFRQFAAGEERIPTACAVASPIFSRYPEQRSSTPRKPGCSLSGADGCGQSFPRTSHGFGQAPSRS
jgi:hypothetical protein